MARRAAKGYFVKGQFVAEGSELDRQLQQEAQAAGPSRTALKRASAELQDLGAQLVALPPGQRRASGMPDALAAAVDEAARIDDFEGRRRQMQYVGKLMRRLDDDQIAGLRRAVEAARTGHREATAELHLAERWRQRLLESDAALDEWMVAHPRTDAQRLRSIVRQARKDQGPTAEQVSRGEAPRRGRAWRELFQIVREGLVAHAT